MLAVSTGSAAQIEPLLSSGVAFYSPAFAEPALGRPRVARVLALAGRVYGELALGDCLGAGHSAAAFFTARIGRHELQVCYRIELDEEGGIARVDALIRPLDAAQELVRRMMQALDAGTAP